MSDHSRVIDLRSDTITKPTPAMRAAMAAAEVGDDVFGEDPTVRELESETAALLGKEAALFVVSGTMANQLAVRIQTESADEICRGRAVHLCYFPASEAGAVGFERCLVPVPLAAIAAFLPLRMSNPCCARPTRISRLREMVCIENTHNRGGGKIWPLERIEQIAALARKNVLHGVWMVLRLCKRWAVCGLASKESRWAAPFRAIMGPVPPEERRAGRVGVGRVKGACRTRAAFS